MAVLEPVNPTRRSVPLQRSAFLRTHSSIKLRARRGFCVPGDRNRHLGRYTDFTSRLEEPVTVASQGLRRRLPVVANFQHDERWAFGPSAKTMAKRALP